MMYVPVDRDPRVLHTALLVRANRAEDNLVKRVLLELCLQVRQVGRVGGGPLDHVMISGLPCEVKMSDEVINIGTYQHEN